MKSNRVVYIKNDRVQDGGAIRTDVLLDTLQTGLKNLFLESDVDKIWRSLFSPKEVVAIKVNCLAGKGLSTHPELVLGIVNQLQKIGLPSKNIIVFDRADQDLRRAGFKIATSPSQVRCAGNNSLGYRSELLMHRTIGSMISQAVVEADAIINLPVLKDHGIVGVSAAMKNFFGVIHNPNKYHLNVGDPYVADLCSHPLIQNKVRLTICDTLMAQYEAGPPFVPQYAIQENSLLLSQDMVALDRIAWQMIDTWRQQNRLPSLKAVGREPHYILTAADAEHQLGEADINRIDFKMVRM